MKYKFFTADIMKLRIMVLSVYFLLFKILEYTIGFNISVQLLCGIALPCVLLFVVNLYKKNIALDVVGSLKSFLFFNEELKRMYDENHNGTEMIKYNINNDLIMFVVSKEKYDSIDETEKV